jgi:hypothetical protein
MRIRIWLIHVIRILIHLNTLILIRIHLFTLILILPFSLMRIYADPVPQQWFRLNFSTFLISGRLPRLNVYLSVRNQNCSEKLSGLQIWIQFQFVTEASIKIKTTGISMA